MKKSVCVGMVWGMVVVLGAGCSGKKTLPPEKVSAGGTAAPAVTVSSQWNGSPESEMNSRFRPVVGTQGMVASDDEEAAKWGVEILRQGGNAVDAAVATAFYMAVTRPHFASIGGGGFMIYCPAPGKARVMPKGGVPECYALDYREKAPGKATRDMYIRNGKGDTSLSQDGALAPAVPGVVAGLTLVQERFGKWGKLGRPKVLQRPIAVAQRGSVMTGHMESVTYDRWEAMNDAAKKIFGCRIGGALKPCEPGTVIKQLDLARVLSEVSAKGREGFYKGWVAQRIASGVQAAGGIITEADLAAYAPVWRKPVGGTVFGHEVVSMPPPSSGGALVYQILKYAEMADEAGAFQRGLQSVAGIHAVAHAMTLAFADRAQFFGDPDFVKVPIDRFLSLDYMRKRWKETYRPSQAQWPENGGNLMEGDNTTHFSVIDAEGNAVAVTTTVNDNFGSGFVPPGTGVMLNNQMDDFSIQPGVANQFGLVGNQSGPAGNLANEIAPGKRPLSSMSPTIVRDSDGQVRMVVGAQGGPKIISATLQAILKRLRFQQSLPEAVVSGRFHHQWKPKALQVETDALTAETIDGLKALGYEIKFIETVGKMHALERYPNGRVWGISDPRAEGAAVAQ